MGDLLHFPVHRTARSRPAAQPPPAFFFDVADPLSYLTAERVERRLGEVEWVPVDGSALLDGRVGRDRVADAVWLRADAEALARAVRLPLVWPETFPMRAPAALRATAFACELGAGAAFALAVSRLAFCGGFDLEDPETLAEAAAAAGVPLGACLGAARESWRDEELRETARLLRAEGVGGLPAFRIGGRWLDGETGLLDGSGLLTASGVAQRPLAPVG